MPSSKGGVGGATDSGLASPTNHPFVDTEVRNCPLRLGSEARAPQGV